MRLLVLINILFVVIDRISTENVVNDNDGVTSDSEGHSLHDHLLEHHEHFGFIGHMSEKVIKCDTKLNYIITKRNSKSRIHDYMEIGRSTSNLTELSVMMALCTHYSVATIVGVDLFSLEISQVELKNTLYITHKQSYALVRTEFPHLKLTLSLLLVSRGHQVDYRTLINTITDAPENRQKFIKGISKTLLKENLQGIELSIITDLEPISHRLKALLNILLHDLHEELRRNGMTLGLNVEYDARPSNFLNDPNLLNQVDYVNLVPYSGEISPNIPNPNITEESIKYFVDQGVLPSKIVVGTLNYAVRHSAQGNRSHYVHSSEVCSKRKAEPDNWLHSQIDGIQYLKQGNVTYLYASEEKTTKSIQTAIEDGVGGFMMLDTVGDLFAGTFCSENEVTPYSTLGTIHSLLLQEYRILNSTSTTTEPLVTRGSVLVSNKSPQATQDDWSMILVIHIFAVYFNNYT